MRRRVVNYSSSTKYGFELCYSYIVIMYGCMTRDDLDNRCSNIKLAMPSTRVYLTRVDD